MKEETLEARSSAETQESSLCPNCGSTDISTTWTEDAFSYGVGTEQVQLTARVPLRTCAACGYQYYDEEAEDARHEAVCRHLGVQTPAEIQALRKKYGLSRAEFADLTKLGDATIARWERGALIQNAANDRYLRLLQCEENVERLRNLEDRMVKQFTVGRRYSREEISDKLGGSRVAYLPFKDGRVVCGCFRPDPEYNPNAPEEILLDEGPVIQESAKLVSEQQEPIPVFLFKGNCEWEYVGLYRCCGFETDPKLLQRKMQQNPARGVIKGVLYFERAS
jgi:putative zinc finger/helix-turn-helix YgiT family protein